LLAVGLDDLVTTAAATEYALNRHALDRARVRLLCLESGHMSYLRESASTTLAAEIRSLVTRLTPA
jgi:hypothetical protein